MLKEMNSRGLAYLDDGSVQASVATDIAGKLRVLHASGSVVLDAARDLARNEAQLETVDLLARNRGFAIATATAFPETVDTVAQWAKAADKRGILIVLFSTLVKDYGR